MIKRIIISALTASMLASAAGAAYAQEHPGAKNRDDVMQVKVTCGDLADRFDALYPNGKDRPTADDAKSLREQGLMKCQQGDVAGGTSDLLSALQMIGGHQ